MVNYRLIFWFIPGIFFVGRFQFFTELFQHKPKMKKISSDCNPLKTNNFSAGILPDWVF